MRKKKNNSGYTLIELLAVLIVLSIIIVIVIPVFYKVIANVKKSAIKSSANGLMKSADLYYINNMDNMEDAVEFKINNGVQVSDYKLKYSGKVKMGYLMLFKDNKIAICIDDGEYAAAKGVNDKDLTVYSGTCTGEYDSETMSYLVSQRTGGFMALSIRSYSSKNDLPTSARSNDLGIITDTKITGYYISGIVPDSPEEGLVWIVESPKSPFYLESDNIRLGITYVMQYEAGKWNIKQAYAYNNEWKLLYYVDIASGNINLENSNLGDINIVNNFDYTGEYQEFTAPFSGYYNVELWGAQGGTNYSTAPGGLGSYTSGDIYLDTGSKIYIYVGGTNSNPSGGWNGGGDGASLGQGSAGGGGGATDIRITPSSFKTAWGEFDSLKSRIMVAAGGGGGSYYASSYYGSGGAGGGLLGYASNIVAGDASPGSGANTTYGGRSKYDSNAAKTTLGGFGYGGKSYITWSAAGGGGGYYGGGGGSYAGAGGGGGSSYISGHEGCNSINDNSTSGNIIFSGKQIHYSDIFFINTLMVDGQGYNWSSTKQMLTRMPSYDGSTTIVGNTGSGHAKITLRTVEQVDQSSRNNLREENEKVWNYTYSGNYQILEIEKNGIYNVQLWGAKGGANNSNAPGGLGSYTSGNIYLKEGTTIYFYIGGTPVFTESGWNGGGEGATNSQGSAGGGGGSTDVRIMDGSWGEFDSLKSRIMVAAGGGGGSYYTMDYYGKGGAGGGVSGYTGSIVVGGASPGTGGKSNYAGTSYYDNNALTTTVGGFGFGGKAYPSWSAAGGGGGFYGGGGGSFAGASGGGGASYISGHGGCNSILETSTSNNIIHSGSAYHYNGYYFTSTNMVDGQGYNWSSYIQARTYMPNINYSGTMTGNAENGYGKVTLIEEKTIDDATINSNYIANDNLWAYDANSRMQYFNATKDGTYKIELWGAQGATNYPSTPGGLGAYTSGEIYLTQGTKLYVGVGTMQVTLNSTLGGWNGGGNGASIVSGSAGGGGGATDIRISNTSLLNLWNEASSLRSRIMVAGGGGGGSFYGSSYYGTGGSGGGLIGYTGYNVVGGGSPGIGGNQVLGGFSSYDASAKNVTMGEYGIGGKSYTSWSAAGGGGGHYGGGGGSFAGASGGGGSSFISGHPGCIAITSGGIPKVETYSNLSDSVSYTGYKFVNTTMIDGSGYPWTTTKSVSSSGMPSPSSANTQTGNSGNGYAKITYLGD